MDDLAIKIGRAVLAIYPQLACVDLNQSQFKELGGAGSTVGGPKALQIEVCGGGQILEEPHTTPANQAHPQDLVASILKEPKRRGRPVGSVNAKPYAGRPPGRPQVRPAEETLQRNKEYKQRWARENADRIRQKRLDKKKAIIPAVCDGCGGSGTTYWSDGIYGPCISCRCPGCGARTRKECKC